MPQKNNITSLIYGSPTTNANIHIAQILKQSATPPTPVPTVRHESHPPRVMPVSTSVTKEPRLVPETKDIHNKTDVAAQPRAKHKTTRHHSIPLQHRHPVVQKKITPPRTPTPYKITT